MPRKNISWSEKTPHEQLAQAVREVDAADDETIREVLIRADRRLDSCPWPLENTIGYVRKYVDLDDL